MCNINKCWVSAEERLPETDGMYLVTVHYTDDVMKQLGMDYLVKLVNFSADYEKSTGKPRYMPEHKYAWYFDKTPTGYPETIDNVIAWMPLPDPYKD